MSKKRKTVGDGPGRSHVSVVNKACKLGPEKKKKAMTEIRGVTLKNNENSIRPPYPPFYPANPVHRPVIIATRLAGADLPGLQENRQLTSFEGLRKIAGVHSFN